MAKTKQKKAEILKSLIETLQNKYTIILATITLLLFSAGFLLHQFTSIFSNSADIINYYGFSLTIIAITVAIIQTTRTHDWNRRLTAIEHLTKIREDLKIHTPLINKHFRYNERSEDDLITVDEIHGEICLKNDKGEYEQDPTTKKLKLHKSDEAKEIRSAIVELLNTYEGLAAGVYQGIYDIDVIKELMASNIIKASTVFGRYIDHLNKEMYPDRNNQIWINLKTLGAEFRKEFRPDKEANKRSRT